MAWVLGDSVFMENSISFVSLPPSLILVYLGGKKKAVLSLLCHLITASPWQTFRWKVASGKFFNTIKKMGILGWLFPSWLFILFVLLGLDLQKNSQGFIPRIHIIWLIGHEETIQQHTPGRGRHPEILFSLLDSLWSTKIYEWFQKPYKCAAQWPAFLFSKNKNRTQSS